VGDEPEHGGERRELRVDGERRLLGALDEERAVGVDAGERAEAPELAVGGGGEVELADGVADLCLREVRECVLCVCACRRLCACGCQTVLAGVCMQAHLHDARVAGGGEVLDAELDRAVDAVDEAERLQAGDGVLVLRRGLLLHVAHVRDVVADELAGEHAEVVQQVLAELRFREGVLGAGVCW